MAIGFFKAIGNMLRERKEDAAKALADPIRDEKFDIADKKREIANFTRELAGLVAEIKKLDVGITEAAGEKAKYDSYAKQAAGKVQAGDTAKDWANLLNQAAGQVSRFEGIVTTKTATRDQQKKIQTTLQKKLDDARNQIAMREQNLASNSARLRAANISTKLNEAAAGLVSGDGSPDPLADQVRQAEAEASAVADLAATPDQELDAAFSGADVAASGLADKYLADATG